MALLDDINSPEDLKKLPRSELHNLALEIRQLIVDVVSKTGGHLASNLGAVELTIALHYVFDVPRDKIVWDVGHQSYTHKILTGRRERFPTLRQHGGISGFPRISESPCDAFSTGHSGTSISAGLGITCAKDLKKQRDKVICIIGDGSMTAGLAYEGLNHAGDLDKDIIVILNDNELSISPNVGALSSLLSRTFSSRYLQDWRKEIGELLRSLPRIGNDAYYLAKRAEESFKALVTPGMLFESFNFSYFGPIKGHRLDQLIDILSNIKNQNDPVLLHVATTKGKGYAPAEKNPVYFHGVGCFEVKTGNNVNGSCGVSYTRIFGETMLELAEENEKIVAVTAAMPEGTGLAPFSEKFPDRFFDVGIAEPHGVTFAGGMATEGFIPVVAIYSTFLQRAYDQVIHDICLDSLHVVFAVDRGGIVGEDGPTHHGLFDLAYLRSLPNMVVMAPKDGEELKKMLRFATFQNGPVAVRYPRGDAIEIGLPEADASGPIRLGKAELLVEGDDVVIFAIGHSVLDACKAARKLAETENLSATVVNCRFVKPLDKELVISLVKRIPRVITVEEGVLFGGFGSAVIECLADAGLSGYRIKRIGIDDTFVEHGEKSVLRAKYGLDADGIVKIAKQLVTDE
ncbi:MAG: 1-deoxy-D-xylulose-5-phosphate synthase [Desulfosalsimonadaceae bacterium]